MINNKQGFDSSLVLLPSVKGLVLRSHNASVWLQADSQVLAQRYLLGMFHGSLLFFVASVLLFC